MINGNVGKPSMWSPEVQKKQPYNFNADYYAFGIIMH